jgi:hypothetical protein
MIRRRLLELSALLLGCFSFVYGSDLSALKRNQTLSGFRVAHLYSDSSGKIIGAKFFHSSTGTPVFLLQLETVPQALTWVETPVDSNRGLPHSLEHLLVGKGTKGRYFHLLQEMRLSQSAAFTSRDFTAYGLSSGAGVHAFFEVFHALLDALYRPDFTDVEAEQEFYHFGVSGDQGKRSLTEQGTVYAEQLAIQQRYRYHYELNRLLMGEPNPLSFDSTGAVEEMRNVRPDEIRAYHRKYYHLGANSGFIFVFPPDQDYRVLLERITQQFDEFSKSANPFPAPATAHLADQTMDGPKYTIKPSGNLEPVIYPFPGSNASSASFVHFAWRPVKVESQAELRLLEVFAHGLAGGEDSLLHKAVVDSKTRVFDSGATAVDSALFLDNSPAFPILLIEIGGIPGNQLTPEKMKQLRKLLLSRIQEVAQYADGSESLMEFNRAAAAHIVNLEGAEAVSTREAPGLGLYRMKTDWKAQFERLEMDQSFVRPVAEGPAWRVVREKVNSDRNIWRELIQKFDLLDVPYATATAPSPQLLEQIKSETQDRIKKKIQLLMAQYGTQDEQAALARFEQDGQNKAEQIEKIVAAVPHAHFLKDPPLVPDRQVEYSQFRVGDVPVIASSFKAPSTIDVGLSFDLRKVPRSYYRYLPLFVKCIDSLGLNKRGQVTPYALLRRRISQNTYALVTGYEIDPIAPRTDFTIRLSVSSKQQLRSALDLIEDMMKFNYLEPENVDRMRDVIASNISADDWYPRQDVSVLNAGYAFYYKDDPLFFALQSRFTKAHWNSRLKWLIHAPVAESEIEVLEDFTKGFLGSLAGISRQDLSTKLSTVQATGLQGELVEYWKKNLPNFPDAEMTEGLRQLALEVSEDLRTGMAKAFADLKALQALALNRSNLKVDLMASRSELAEIQSDLASFLQSIPPSPPTSPFPGDTGQPSKPVVPKLRARYPGFEDKSPWNIGFVNTDYAQGSVVFYGDFPGYAQLDRKSLVEDLASKLFAGRGPQTFFTKSLERGLAYDNGVVSDPKYRVIWYSANRSSDIPSLIDLVNATASKADLADLNPVDYVLSQIFAFSREMNTFSERGRALAQDVRDGNSPEKIRLFSEAILRLRQEPDLQSQVLGARITAICAVLLRDDCKIQQKTGRSLFFFVGSEKVLADAEKRLSIPTLFRVWPSDFWLP